ncbi:MAG: response regulator [Phycisphaerae bacterium]
MPRSVFVRWLLTIVIATNLFFIGLAGYALWQGRQQYQQRAEITTLNLSHALAGHLADAIDKIDLTVLTVADEVADQLAHGGIDAQELNAIVIRHHARLPALDGLRVVNALGENAYGIGVTAGVRASVADRAYFARLCNDPKAGLVISEPVLGRVSKKWSIIFARRVNQPDGSFAGLVYGTITLEHFLATFSYLDVGPHGTIVLRNEEMALIARYPEPQDVSTMVGKQNASPELQNTIQMGHDTGTYRTTKNVENIQRTYSYSKVSDRPFYLIVGLAEEDYLANWRNEATALSLLVTLFVLGSILSSWLVYRGWRRRLSATQALALQEAQRRQVQETLRHRDDDIRVLLDSAAEAIYGIDMHGNCTFCNPSCLRLLGYSQAEEFLGKNMHWVTHHKHADGTPFPVESCRIFQAFQQGVGTHVEDEVLWRADGSCFPVEYWSHPQHRNGVVIGAVVTFLDITERRLDALGLKLATESAAQSSRAKSEFVANMSHELRTPLNAVIGLAELLCGTELNPKQRQFAQGCHSSATTLLALINDILDFSKIEAGKMELDLHDFDLEQIIAETLAMFAPQAHAKGLELISLIAPEARLLLRGDAVRLRQILSNLISNALKFTRAGRVTVHLTAEAAADQHLLLRCRVTDTGIGVPPDRIQRLFSPFTQVDSSTTRRYGGTGLGLAICKNLVLAMGCEVGIESTLGVGSTFWFTARLQVLACPIAWQARITPELQHLRVLVCIVEPISQAATIERLISWGLGHDVARDAPTAWAQVQTAAVAGQPYNLLLLDETLADHPPLGQVAALRTALGPQAPKVFLLTSFGKDHTPELIAALGITESLPKPLTPSTLLDTIVRTFQKATPEVPAAPAAAAPEVPSHKLRILLAEDNVLNQLVAGEILRRAGYDCDLANNGSEALAALTRQPYDLILMDCQMPELDGLDTTRQIRRDEQMAGRGSHVPIIALTANALKGDREHCLNAGMDDYLSKPLNGQSMLAKIALLLTGKPLAPPPGPALGATPATAVPIDIDVLFQHCLGDLAFLAKILQVAKTEIPGLVECISEHLTAGASQQVTLAAHSLKGATGQIGARTLQSLAADIEACGRAGDLDRAGRQLAELQQEVQRCLTFIPQVPALLESRGASGNTPSKEGPP